MKRKLPIVRERTVAMRSRVCRTPGCGNRAYSRGLCRACYQAAYRIVSEGTLSWSDLENRGKVNAAREGSPKAWFLAS